MLATAWICPLGFYNERSDIPIDNSVLQSEQDKFDKQKLI